MNDPDIKLTSFLKEEKIFVEDLKKVDVEKNWERFLKTTSGEKATRRKYSLGKRNKFLVRSAAAIFLAVLGITSFYLASNRSAQQIIKASTDSQLMELTLSDGTAITLNKETILIYPEKQKRRKREVSLEGEAFFQVEHAAKSPFYIHMGEWTVKVVGTSFNLKTDDTGHIEVRVVQGKVLVYEKGNHDQAIKLVAGEEFVRNTVTGEAHKAKIQSENYLYWKTKKLIYRDEPLDKVLSELESQFGQKIIVSDPLLIQNRWNSTHEGQKLSEILDELCLYFNLEYNLKDDTIFLQRK